MKTVDPVLVPSIWRENSLVVIREALRNNRPVLCSDIGGMAEKVRPGPDGLYFKVGDAPSLSILLEDLSASAETLETLRGSIQASMSPDDSLQQHIVLYSEVLTRNTR